MFKYTRYVLFILTCFFFISVSASVFAESFMTKEPATAIQYKQDNVDLQMATINVVLLVFLFVGIVAGVAYFLRWKGIKVNFLYSQNVPVKIIYSRRISARSVVFKLQIEDISYIILETGSGTTLLDREKVKLTPEPAEQK